MFDQFDYYKYLDSHPFTGIRDVDFDAKISTSEHIIKFFNGTQNYEQVRNVTPGKIYHIFKWKVWETLLTGILLMTSDKKICWGNTSL